MRVALFTDTFLPDVNGVARTLGRWVDYLQSSGVPCKVFAPHSVHGSGGTPYDRMVERFAGIPFLLYPECRMAIPNPLQLRRLLDDFAPTLIHVATPFNLGLLGIRYAKKRHIPLVASYHTHFDQYLHYYKLPWMENVLWRYMAWFHQECRRIYVPSQSTLTHLAAKGFRGLEVWSRGVDVARFKPQAAVGRVHIRARYGIAPDTFVLLYVGRLAPEKSVDVLLRAYDALSPAVRRNARLVVAGDGPLLDELAEQRRRDDSVVFPGFVHGEALAELYAAADVFAFPSATETFGNVVLEAMASGTAVVGAAAGGVQDTVRHERTGLLCQPGDAAAFARAIERLHGDERLRGSLAEEGLRYSREQSWERIFSRLLDSYRAVSGTLTENGPQPVASAK